MATPAEERSPHIGQMTTLSPASRASNLRPMEQLPQLQNIQCIQGRGNRKLILIFLFYSIPCAVFLPIHGPTQQMVHHTEYRVCTTDTPQDERTTAKNNSVIAIPLPQCNAATDSANYDWNRLVGRGLTGWWGSSNSNSSNSHFKLPLCLHPMRYRLPEQRTGCWEVIAAMDGCRGLYCNGNRQLRRRGERMELSA